MRAYISTCPLLTVSGFKNFMKFNLTLKRDISTNSSVLRDDDAKSQMKNDKKDDDVMTMIP